jgi:TonB family protein
MLHEGHSQVSVAFQVCLDETGSVTKLKMLGAGSGYAEYDAALSAAIHAWRYRPYLVDDRPTPVCGVVSFIYTMK